MLTVWWLMRVAVIVPSVAKHTEQRFQPTQASIRMNSVGLLAKIRLAFMNHRGLPVTYIALILPLLFLARDGMAAADFHLLLGLALAVVGLLFVINVPVPKPRGMFYVILPLLAAGLIAHWVERYLQFSISL